MNLLLQVGYSAASILWARTPPGRWDKNISIRVVFSCPRQLNKWAWKWNVFYFTGNGYWMGWNTLCLSTYCINEVIWALIFPKNEKEQISLTFYIVEISVLFSRSCSRSSSSGSRALFLLLLSPPSLLHLGRALPCCSRLCPLSDKG